MWECLTYGTSERKQTYLQNLYTTIYLRDLVNRGYDRIYIQSAWMIPDDEKMQQETFSLKHTGDSFRKVVINGHPMSARYIDNDDIGHINLIDFLLDPKSIETI